MDKDSKVNGTDEPQHSDSTLGKVNENLKIGRLRVVSDLQCFDLKPGRNIIGRKTDSSTADFQIECPSNRMSREHVQIEVRRVPKRGIVHLISLCKQQVNPTYIGHIELEHGDVMELMDGMYIHLPDADLRFEIEDNEKTRM